MITERTVELKVNISESAFRAMEDIAKDRGTTLSDVFRRAVATEKFIHDELTEGNKILIEKRNGDLSQVLWK